MNHDRAITDLRICRGARIGYRAWIGLDAEERDLLRAWWCLLATVF